MPSHREEKSSLPLIRSCRVVLTRLSEKTLRRIVQTLRCELSSSSLDVKSGGRPGTSLISNSTPPLDNVSLASDVASESGIIYRRCSVVLRRLSPRTLASFTGVTSPAIQSVLASDLPVRHSPVPVQEPSPKVLRSMFLSGMNLMLGHRQLLIAHIYSQ